MVPKTSQDLDSSAKPSFPFAKSTAHRFAASEPGFCKGEFFTHHRGRLRRTLYQAGTQGGPCHNFTCLFLFSQSELSRALLLLVCARTLSPTNTPQGAPFERYYQLVCSMSRPQNFCSRALYCPIAAREENALPAMLLVNQSNCWQG